MPRELWFVKPREVEVREAREPPALAGRVRAKAIASGISQGTELLLYCGEGTTPFDPSLDAPNQPTYPRRYGYAWVGEVTDGPLAPGTRIFALAPHGDVHSLDPRDARPLPSTIPPTRAVLAANLETAITAVWDGGVALGDRVIVCGAGLVGLLVTRLSVLAGANEVTVVEPSERRRAAALTMGATRAVKPDDASIAPADVVFELSGRPEALTRCLQWSDVEARVVVASNYGARVAPVALGDVFHRRRLQLVSSQVSAIPPQRGARWDHARRFALVTALLADPTLDALIEAPVPFASAPSVYGELAAARCERLQVVFEYGAA